MKFKNQIQRLIYVGAGAACLPWPCCLSVLTACGGGGGASGSVGLDTFQFQPQNSVMVMSTVQTGAIVQVAPTQSAATTSAGIDVTFNADVSNTFASGQVVSIPQDESKGFPFGFVGKVVSQQTAGGSTTVTLAPASLTEVYKNLNIDYDSGRNGMRVVGVISPTGSFSQAPSTTALQTGAIFPGVDLKVVLGDKGIKFDVDVPFEIPISDEADAPILYVALKGSDIQIQQNTTVKERV